MIKVAFVLEVKPYQQLKFSSFIMDKEAKISFENSNIRQHFTDLLIHNCQTCPTKPTFINLVSLKVHLRKEHELFLCDLCIDNLKIFTWERKCYTRSELALHRRKGDIDNTSHRGHPLCNFCDQRYYENDDLFRHLRRDHYFCHFCDADGLNHYYCNYEDLRLHFREAHFLCEEGDCKEEKFTRVFRTDIDFRAHRTQVHIQSLGKAAAKQARTLELEFTLAPRASESRGRGQRRNLPREREKEEPPNIEEASARPVEAVQIQSTNIRDPQQFPSLTNEQATTSKGRSNGSDSLAQKLAKGNRFTVRSGTDGSRNEDFPSLSAEPSPSESASKSKALKAKSAPNEATGSKRSVHLKVSNQDGAKSKTPNVSIQVMQNYSAVSQTAAAAPAQARVTRVSSSQNIQVQPSRGGAQQLDADFPSLVPKKAQPAPALVANSTWVKKEVPKLHQPLLKPAAAPVKNQRPTAADFPVLGPSSSSKLPFVESLKKAASKEKSAGGSRAASVTIPVGESWSEPAKSKGKKKKNSCKTGAADDMNESIAFQTPAERKIAEMQIGELRNLSTHMGGHTFDLTSVANGIDSRPLNTSKLSLVKAPDAQVELSNGGVKPKTKAISLSHDNFPSLGGKNAALNSKNSFFSEPTPPRVAKKAVAAAKLPLQEDATPTRVTFTSSSGRHFPLVAGEGSAAAAAAADYTFLQPPEFAVRNQGLITTVTDLLCDQQNRFSQFRTVSAQFRSGQVQAAQYYDRCMDIMGDACFQAVYPELLVLLPDIEKQQELLQVHRTEMRSGGSSAGTAEPYVICATCSQVLAPCDLKHHLASHNLETHFPALSARDSSTSPWTRR